MRRNLIGTAVIAALLAVLSVTSGFRLASDARPEPSEVGVETQMEAPFEFGSVQTAQSFR